MISLRFNLQAKILLLVAGSMLLILVASSYLHSGRIRSLIERDHYVSAVNQTVALSDRIATGNNRKRTAEILGINRKTLYRMAARFEIQFAQT